MHIFEYTPEQINLLQLPLKASIFLEGPAGSGKTTAAVGRALGLLKAGVRADTILLLTPQRSLAQPYYDALRAPDASAGGVVDVLTVGGLARRVVNLFWPLVAEKAGFAQPDALPTFLTLETAQYYMALLVRPLLEEGLFDSLAIDRNRLYSQLLDNLNKAAVMGYSSGEVGERLSGAWVGEPGQLRIYQDVQTCLDLFRQFCLAHNLLDFSLQVEVFQGYLWGMPEVRAHLEGRYDHLIYDNLEEDTPAAHDLVREWLPAFASALLVYDRGGGYRSFLGADAQGAYDLKEVCDQKFAFERSLVMSAPVYELETRLVDVLGAADRASAPRNAASPYSGAPGGDGDLGLSLHYNHHRFYPEMLNWVAGQIAELVLDKGIPPGEIVVLAPFLSDSLRFSLANRLEQLQIPWRSFRPSRSLRNEPATACLATLAALAHPEWGLAPTSFDFAHALIQAIDEMDLVRAQLLTGVVYRRRAGGFEITSFDEIKAAMQERITYRLGERFEVLKDWLQRQHNTDAPGEQGAFDHFLGRLFGEVLSQPGFGFHGDYDAGRVTANLIESVQKFRWVAGDMLNEMGVPLGQEYLHMLNDGVIAAQYLGGWRTNEGEAVLLAPAYTFLMSNRPVDIQFWLDVGARSWSERLYQPLTHPYVLSRAWPVGRIWTDADEVAAEKRNLHSLTSGLLHRCRSAIYLGLSELGEGGYEQRGPLLQAFQHVLRAMNP